MRTLPSWRVNWRKGALAAVGAALVAVGAGAMPAHGSPLVTIVLEQRVTKSELLDLGAPGLTAGDVLLFEAELKNQAGDVVGTNWGFCAVVTDGGTPGIGPFEEECRESLVLPSGQVDVQGLFNRTSFDSLVPQILAVTGGSGDHERAHGEATFTKTGAETAQIQLAVESAVPAPASFAFERQIVRSTFFDRGNPGRSGGDQTLVAAELRNAAAQVVGQSHSFCITVADGNLPGVGPFRAQCQESLSLAEGQIVVEGLLDETAYDAGSPQVLAIVGGTGAYRSAHGEVTVAKTGASTASLQVELDPPGGCTPETRTFVEQGTQFYQVSDSEPERDAGDLLTSVSSLLDPLTLDLAGETYAYFLTVADTMNAAPFIAQASQTIVLENGGIEMGGQFNQTAFEAFAPATFVINGGTGAYRKAHGTVLVQQVMLPATFQLTIDVVCDPPTAVALTGFVARRTRRGVELNWRTEWEVDRVGFNVWRSATPRGGFVKLNSRLIPAAGAGGAGYRYRDRSAPRGAPAYYRLELLSLGGRSSWAGPIAVGTPR